MHDCRLPGRSLSFCLLVPTAKGGEPSFKLCIRYAEELRCPILFGSRSREVGLRRIRYSPTLQWFTWSWNRSRLPDLLCPFLFWLSWCLRQLLRFPRQPLTISRYCSLSLFLPAVLSRSRCTLGNLHFLQTCWPWIPPAEGGRGSDMAGTDNDASHVSLLAKTGVIIS